MEKPSGYRDEQMRVLRRGFVRRLAIGLVVWSALFGVWAVAVDAFVAPRVADAVASLCPWRAVSQEEARLEDTVWYEESRERAVDAMVSCYAGMLVDDAAAYEEASDEARAMADAVAAMRHEGSGAARESTDASEVSETQDAPSVDADSDAAQESDNGAVHEYRMPADPEGAVVAEAMAALDASAEEALFEEACTALGTSSSAVRVESPWSDEQSRALWNEIYYADGHMEYRDLRLYDAVRFLRLPLAVAAYALVAAVAVWFAVSWLMRRFGSVFDAVATLFSGNGDMPDLPGELAPTARALDDVRRRHDDAQRAALAAEQRKNELVAYLAHDIRTPLTSVVGYLTLLSEAPDMPEEQRARYAQVALDRSYRLESMMEEFFEITRYNLSSIPIERCHFDAGLLCRQVADEFYPSASARAIDIDVQAADSIECFADAEKVSRVLNNLLKNAVAYADEESTVTVRARLEETPAEEVASPSAGAPDAASPQEANKIGKFLVIDVENQGREISPEHVQAIFEKFYREDGARSTQGGGAGLGLAIAREIARAHGGDLNAQSVAGRTTFTLRVPA